MFSHELFTFKYVITLNTLCAYTYALANQAIHPFASVYWCWQFGLIMPMRLMGCVRWLHDIVEPIIKLDLLNLLHFCPLSFIVKALFVCSQLLTLWRLTCCPVLLYKSFIAIQAAQRKEKSNTFMQYT